MANSRSARKRIRANERKHVRNRSVRSAVRTKVGKARRALVGLEETLEAQERLRTAVSALDRAAEKGILHRKNAARRKSRIMVIAHRIAVATEQGEEALAAARTTALGGEKGRKAAAGSRPRAGAPMPGQGAGEATDAAAVPAKVSTRARAKAPGTAPVAKAARTRKSS